jgi:hypothetical protein
MPPLAAAAIPAPPLAGAPLVGLGAGLAAAGGGATLAIPALAVRCGLGPVFIKEPDPAAPAPSTGRAPEPAAPASTLMAGGELVADMLGLRLLLGCSVEHASSETTRHPIALRK